MYAGFGKYLWGSVYPVANRVWKILRFCAVLAAFFVRFVYSTASSGQYIIPCMFWGFLSTANTMVVPDWVGHACILLYGPGIGQNGRVLARFCTVLYISRGI